MWGFRSTLWLVSPVLMIDKRPDKVGKRFAVLFHLQVRPRITNNCLNFPTMADNPASCTSLSTSSSCIAATFTGSTDESMRDSFRVF